jgi:hypothetical protein
MNTREHPPTAVPIVVERSVPVDHIGSRVRFPYMSTFCSLKNLEQPPPLLNKDINIINNITALPR